MTCQRRALTTCVTMRMPTAASHSSTRSRANASPTRGQSVCQAIHVNNTALTPIRSSLLTYFQLLFHGFRPRLIKPAVPRIDHVDEQAAASRFVDRRHNDHKVDGLVGRHGFLEEAGHARRDLGLIRINELERQMNAADGVRAEV